jgi:serine/threonine protein phosphatase PrpC
MTDSSAIVSPRKPRDDEIDVFGITHPGKVRKDNQDHFLLGSLRKRLDILSSSLPAEELPLEDERVAFLAMVADGVGGGRKGESASRLALEEVTQYISESARCYYQMEPDGSDFVATLKEAAARTHERILKTGVASPETSGMATTLTLFIGLWPWIYLLQVGDSRYYIFREGKLNQITRDQTMAQELSDQGVLTPEVARASRLANVLSSSIGGPQTAPVVSRLPSDWRNVHLLCSDGLTKHVSDEQITKRLSAMQSSRQACEVLLQDALDGGGTDNITIIVGRGVEKKE